ncbi:TenA family protein [Rickettsiella endosymbiont of Dermanyssus gallinae]|uniref:TenA family protein n=1 Tax=Rickettsiella endosymbiont of Dermanyssus gallinae TaxID=2856608 RepID=UPI001C52796D|nr:TenA family protein [Rickettsiella endosymbiont of Dermanyssus gallinae]
MLFNEMRNRVTTLMPKIYKLPFNQELANGTLPLEKFTFYLAQDALYLADYSKALALTAGRLPHDHQTELFIQFAMDAIKAERDLHMNILKKYAVAVPAKSEQSPFCFMYANYLLRMAHAAPVEEAVASLLPCFWVYQQVGQRALAEKIPNNPYQDWIDLYASPEFNTSVDLAINTLNELGETASAQTKENMLTAFQRATQLEYCFWQGAYAQETFSNKIDAQQRGFQQDAAKMKQPSFLYHT